MNVTRFRLITFDVTDTLLKQRTAPGKQYGEVGALYGVLCDKHSLSANFKAHWHKMNGAHPNFGRHTGLGWQAWWREIVKGAFRDSKINLELLHQEKLDSISDHLIQLYETSMCWQQSYGALGLLSYLRNRGVVLGVISNFDPRLEQTLVNTRLRHYFHFVLGSYDAGVAKPHKDIFEKAIHASKLKDLKQQECLHVGNTALLDYMGAKSCGWNAVLINEKDTEKIKEKYPEVDTNHHFDNLYDLHRQFVLKSGEKLGAHSC